ncbi:FAD binding domain protein, partial [Aspergillus sclerotialis]
MASPSAPVDLPQTLLEPVLVRHATRNGFTTRFNTTLLSFEEDGDGLVIATVRDDLSKQEYRICTRYLFGADGGRSQV